MFKINNKCSIIILFIILFIIYCDKKPNSTVKTITDQIENPNITDGLAIANLEHTAYAIVASSQNSKELIALGNKSVKYLSSRFDIPNLPNKDYALAYYAYILQEIGDRKALPALNKFLSNPQNRQQLFWSIIFAENARSKLEDRSQ